MRVPFAAFSTLLLLAAPASAEELPLESPASSEPSKPSKVFRGVQQQALLDRVIELRRKYASDFSCRDRVSKARELLGKSPLLDREPAFPDNPYLIYAVDRRQDGCSVMVMKGDPDDIRQLPLPMESPLLMIPADRTGE